MRNQHEVCKLIPENIKDIHEKKHDGKTPYDVAKKERNESTIKLLGYPFSSIPESEITQPHLPQDFGALKIP